MFVKSNLYESVDLCVPVMSDTLDIFCRDAVDVSRAYVELRKSNVGKLDVDHDGNDDESFNLPIEESPDAMSPGRDQVGVFTQVYRFPMGGFDRLIISYVIILPHKMKF